MSVLMGMNAYLGEEEQGKRGKRKGGYNQEGEKMSGTGEGRCEE